MPPTRSLRALRTLLSAAAAALIAGCDSTNSVTGPADEPLVQVLVASASAGATVPLRVSNASASTWHYNACASPKLERREGDGWVEAPLPLILCTADIQSLSAGRSETVTVLVPAGYVEGTYRIRFSVLRSDGTPAEPVSNTFTVE